MVRRITTPSGRTMKTNKYKIDTDIIRYLDIPDDPLFLDIESTGLSPIRSFIYMISLVYYEGDSAVFENITAENASEEEQLLNALIPILNSHTNLIHYNGDKFDIPFIEKRCAAYGIELDLKDHGSLDIYKAAKPLKDILGLPGCRQKDIERFLGVHREDKYSGKELIDVYKQYSETRDEDLYKLLYQHNHDDVMGMLKILPILAYRDLFAGRFDTSDIKKGSYTDAAGSEAEEILIELMLHSPVPAPLCIAKDGIYLIAKGASATLKLPVFRGELKYFYDDPKEYYYLPTEDMAVHRSLAQYVDKEHRIPAKPSTCYTKKTGTFLPQFKPLYTPYFKTDHDSKITYFEMDISKIGKEYLISLIEEIK